jgi:hypothetical protein
MLNDGSLLGGLKMHLGIGSASENATPPERIASNDSSSSAGLSKSATQAQTASSISIATQQQRMDPMNLFKGGWPNLQNFIIGLNLAPAGSKTVANPFVERFDSAGDVDPETGEAIDKKALQQIRPPVGQKRSPDDDPFASYRFDSQF